MYGNIKQRNLFDQKIVTETLKNIKVVKWISLYQIEWIYEKKLDLVLGNACDSLHDGYYQYVIIQKDIHKKTIKKHTNL